MGARTPLRLRALRPGTVWRRIGPLSAQGGGPRERRQGSERGARAGAGRRGSRPSGASARSRAARRGTRRNGASQGHPALSAMGDGMARRAGPLQLPRRSSPRAVDRATATTARPPGSTGISFLSPPLPNHHRGTFTAPPGRTFPPRPEDARRKEQEHRCRPEHPPSPAAVRRLPTQTQRHRVDSNQPNAASARRAARRSPPAPRQVGLVAEPLDLQPGRRPSSCPARGREVAVDEHGPRPRAAGRPLAHRARRGRAARGRAGRRRGPSPRASGRPRRGRRLEAPGVLGQRTRCGPRPRPLAARRRSPGPAWRARAVCAKPANCVWVAGP